MEPAGLGKRPRREQSASNQGGERLDIHDVVGLSCGRNPGYLCRPLQFLVGYEKVCLLAQPEALKKTNLESQSVAGTA